MVYFTKILLEHQFLYEPDSRKGRKMDTSELIDRVKANLVVEHDDDDLLLAGLVAAAVDYARAYQRVGPDAELSPATMQAVVMLASHWAALALRLGPVAFRLALGQVGVPASSGIKCSRRFGLLCRMVLSGDALASGSPIRPRSPRRR